MVPINPHIAGAGRHSPSFDYSRGWRDANYNIGRRGTEGQSACKNQSDQSFGNHKTVLLFLATKLRSNPSALPSSSPSKGVIDNQENHRADNRHEKTVEVKSAYAGCSKDMKQPAAGKSADNTQQNVEQDAFTSSVHKLAADEPCNQAENYPS
jgi:hypothetical protein